MSTPDPVLRLVPESNVRRGEHLVHFFEEELALAEAVSAFLGGSLGQGGAAVVVATPEHRASIATRLERRGFDVAQLRAVGRLIELDAAETLSRFLVDGVPDAAKFQSVIGTLLESAAMPGVTAETCVYGEMVALLWGEGRHDAALQLEKLWNDLMRRREFALFCSYPATSFDEASDGRKLLEVCAAHGYVIPAESHAGLASAEERLRLIMQLQQTSRSLEAEGQRRREAEDSARRLEKELADILENVPGAIVDIDADGRIVQVNRQHLDQLDRGEHDVVGRHVGELLATPKVFDETWSRVLRGLPVGEMRVDWRARDGSFRPMTLSAAVLRTVNKSVAMRWFLRDVH